MKIDKIEDISVLIAEDEIELLESLREYVEIFFAKVYTASCGDEAYEIYEKKKPSIILTDINMPNLNGLDMISKIRENDNIVKIIVMSAHSEEEKLLHAIKLHLETYLIKPIRSDELKEILFETVELIRNTQKRIYVDEFVYWDKESKSLWSDSKEVELKNRESLLLTLLFSKPNQAFNAEEIFEYLHKDKKEFSSYSITSLMKRLRSKIPDSVVQNVYGSGYKITSIF
jgi:DNA-binding response OmpR family regulator